MEQFLYYLLRATVTATLFYGVYKLLFSKTTFYAINRIALMLILVSILTVPLFRYDFLPKNEEKPTQELAFVIDTADFPISEIQNQPVEIPWIKILSILYFVGLAFFLVRYAIGLVRLRGIIRKAKTKYRQSDGSIVCISDKEIAPFSWFKYIVLSEQDYTDENKVIIKHEQAHVRLRHSIDRLFYDLMLCLFWFNPFSWLLRRELQSVHEFQADEAVITQGIDAKKYQLLLIRKSVGETKFAMANSFLQRDLQKRISMMMKNKTKSTMKWGYVLIFPLLALTMLVLSVPKLNATVITEENLDSPSEILTEVLVLDEKEKPLVIINDKEQNEKFDLNSLPADNIASISVLKDKSAIAAYGEKGKNGVILIFTKGYKNRVSIADIQNMDKTKKPLIIIDGEEQNENYNLNELSSDEIKSMSVLKGKSAVETYGKKGKNGVVLIITKENNDLSEITPYNIVDEKESKALDSLQRSEVKLTIMFSNPDSAKLINSKEAKESVTLITTKGYKNKVSITDLQNMDKTKKLLVIIDGEEQDENYNLNELSPDEIKSMSVLKEKSAVETYGIKGKNGVILITTKNKENPYGIKKANIKKAPNDYSKTAFVVEDKLVGEMEALAIAPDKIKRITKIADGDALKKIQKKFKTDKTYFMVIELK